MVEINSSQFKALAEFRHRIRRFLHFSEQSARDHGIEPRQHQLMLAVRSCRENEASIGYLAEQLQIRHHSAVELVDRMCEHGLVRRKHSVIDRRRVLVELTAQGNRVLARLSSDHLKELRQAGPALVKSLEAVL